MAPFFYNNTPTENKLWSEKKIVYKSQTSIIYNQVIKNVTLKKIADTVIKHYCVWYLFNCNSL